MATGCGQTYRVDPRLDPATCNALSQGPAGLLVPETSVVGVAPGGNVGTERSVDIDVTPPAAGSCPEVWTIGARLTPVSGSVAPTSNLELSPRADGEWADVPGFSFTAPQTGVYRVQTDVTGVIEWTSQSALNRLVAARLTRNGAVLPNTNRPVIQANFALSGGIVQTGGLNGSATVGLLITLTAGDVIQVQGARLGSIGTTTGIGVGTVGWSVLNWNKVSD